MAARPTTPPILQGPTDKEKRYDRQLRLWAASGQQALEDAHVLLLNSGPGVVGIEALKNLILPGIGSFTIVDENKVREEDLGVNFFLTWESLGRSRAEESGKYLKELNPEVTGYAIQEPIKTFITSKHDTLTQYTLILLVGPTKLVGILDDLSTYTYKNQIPLFYIHSVGFYSQFLIQLPHDFPLVDTHPDPLSTQDLRLLHPWPELRELVRTRTSNLETLSAHDHGHVPYLLLLLHYLEEWKASHNGKPPENYKEKSAFRDILRAGARCDNPEGGEENFDEAVAAVLKSLNPPSISSGLRAVFNEVQHMEDNDSGITQIEQSNFWLIARAIGQFHAKHGVLPLPGPLPDMKAVSVDYIRLQNIYKAKARQDFAEVLATVRSFEKELGRASLIDEREVEAFCKGAAFVKKLEGVPIKEYYLASAPTSKQRGKSVSQEMQDDTSLLFIYLAFQAYDIYFNCLDHETADPPNAEEVVRSMETNVGRIIEASANAVIDKAEGIVEAKVLEENISKVISELGRAAGSELHNISALTGGMVAQEVIKVITKQYIPVDNVCIFDGIASKTATFKMVP